MHDHGYARGFELDGVGESLVREAEEGGDEGDAAGEFVEIDWDGGRRGGSGRRGVVGVGV